ncbi:hypothetical protein CLV78_102149 [Aliiruegeria haliotis]|uniref:Uncharacterized protein n=1 Tax=Aliiruegeria haliotis TaxID=1280846 RepID=A0A2T0RUV2_9RHOB|nr:hypothetical protein [Aliiruegeria haliotis]PRY24975.1 hypothetical protein CLV78_102149 [Aliiruegeria haliotis]
MDDFTLEQLRGFLLYVLRRTMLVAFCLGAGIFGMPNDVGARDTLLQSGEIAATGARRIVVTPGEAASNPTDSAAQQDDGGAPGAAAIFDKMLEMVGIRPSGEKLASADPGLGLVGALERVAVERDNAIDWANAIGAAMGEADRMEGAKARLRREAAAAEKARRPLTLGERLFEEFGARARVQSPYEVSRAALTR